MGTFQKFASHFDAELEKRFKSFLQCHIGETFILLIGIKLRDFV